MKGRRSVIFVHPERFVDRNLQESVTDSSGRALTGVEGPAYHAPGIFP
jgi:hypothetical protein